ncbi:protein kinase [Streptomyces sp. NPDC026665]|uniref:serine/threonine-protein kinase n=1 Tax=Streptomyces sp. NPDC026665 TaxID=3154798 RepID=UPI00340F49B6
MSANVQGGVPGLLVTGRYRLVESIGQGGMGRVWRAADEMLDRQVAVKEMRMDGFDPEDTGTRRERTLREARATARIDHPGVVRVYDVVDAGERLWIVMELVAGRSLERIVSEDGPLDTREAARVGLELVGALRQVHAQGVLHRDIKPGNVLVESAGRNRVVLTDFGIAAVQDTEALTMAGMLVGSPDYMAPERVSGRPQGPPSDVWSLGATLCAALGGRSPFSRSTTLATLHAVLYEEPELTSGAGELREILAALLKKDPAARPGLEDLEASLADLAPAPDLRPVPQPVPYPQPAPEPRPARDPRPAPDPDSRPVPDSRPAPDPRPVPQPVPDPRREPGPPRDPDPGTEVAAPEPGAANASTESSSGPRTEPGSGVPSRLPTEPSSGVPSRLPTVPVPVVPEPDELPEPAVPSGSSVPSGPSVPSGSAGGGRRSSGRRRGEGRSEGRGRGGSESQGQGQGQGQDQGRDRSLTGARRRIAFAAAGVVAAAAVAWAVVAMTGGSPGGAGATAGSSPTSASGTEDPSSPAPTVAGTSRPPSLPAGARREAGGYAWVTPKGWRRDPQTGSEVHYTSPDGTQELAAKSSIARGNLLATWTTSERNAHQGRDYRKIRLEQTMFRGRTAVVWEYTFTLRGVSWHARLLGFDTDGKSFQISTWYHQDVEDRALTVYDRVKDSFTVL